MAFDRFVALQAVDVTVNQGDILGMIGPNGSGKTTLFNVISGICAATSGKVLYKGATVTGKRPHVRCRMGIARTFQVAQPFSQMTAADNVLVAAMHGGGLDPAAGRRKVEEVLHLAGLEGKAGMTPDSMTTCDRRRLELARALASGPEVILLDEALAGLTPAEVDDALKLLRIIQGRGVTIFLIEHVMRAVMRLCNRVVVLNHGVKIAEGTPLEVTSNSEVIEAYLGEPLAAGQPAVHTVADSQDIAAGEGERLPVKSRYPRGNPRSMEAADSQGIAAGEGEPESVKSGVLEVSGLGAGYGRVQVLWDASLRVEEGESVCILGPNGAGKTTLLETIAGMIRPMHGSIIYRGQRIDSAAPEELVREGMALVTESKHLFLDMTVLDNLLMGAYAGMAKDKRSETLAEVYDLFPALAERSKQVVKTLSGGERQMVAIGRAMMSRPDLLLVDEPSIGLTPLMTAKMLEAIRAIHKRGATVLLVEQNVSLTLQMAQRAYVLENGKIVQQGKSADLLENPHIRKAYLAL